MRAIATGTRLANANARGTARRALEARIVSLGGSPRRSLVEENLRTFSVPWRFLDASDADGAFPYASDSRTQLDRYGRALTPGEIGCFKSHVAAISAFDLEPHLDWLLICEDDVWIDTDFPFGDLVGFLEEKRIDYLRLYCRRWQSCDLVASFGERQVIRFRTDPYGAQAYLINRTASSAFRSTIASIDMPIDDLYGRFWESGVDIFALFPFPVIERSLPSTLLSQRARSPIDARRFTAKRHCNRARDFLAKWLRNLTFSLGRLGPARSSRA